MTEPRRPAALISAITAFAFSGELTYVIATSAPSRASRLAIAAPMPRLPPVTSATLPESEDMLLFLVVECSQRPASPAKLRQPHEEPRLFGGHRGAASTRT